MNPYQPPAESPLDPRLSMPGSGTGEVEAAVMESLRQTKPWVMFLGVMGFIGAGFLLLGGGVVAVVGLPDVPGGRAFGLAYVAFAVVYVFPSLFLTRYAKAIRELLAGGGNEALAQAIEQQKKFWRFVGISMVVFMGLYFALIVVFGTLGAMRAMG